MDTRAARRHGRGRSHAGEAMPPDFAFEAEAPRPVCGVDEVGRGPWAGPVVAAAVVLDPARIPDGLDDSKRLTPARRAALHDALIGVARVGVGAASVAEIDALNVLEASFVAMRRAVAALGRRPGPALALVDGRHAPPGLGCPVRAVVGGDAACLSIAAASIVAKVTRDRVMAALAREFPGYGWETNVGYGVAAHAAALTRLGVTPHHRRSFRPVHKMLCDRHTINA
jgi:ribonuclease HII